MIDFKDLKRNIDNEHLFVLATDYYINCLKNSNELIEELPNGITLDDIVVKNKSVSLLIEHPTIPTPSFDICLDIYIKESVFPMGSFHLILDEKQSFLDEFLIFTRSI